MWLVLYVLIWVVLYGVTCVVCFDFSGFVCFEVWLVLCGFVCFEVWLVLCVLIWVVLYALRCDLCCVVCMLLCVSGFVCFDVWMVLCVLTFEWVWMLQCVSGLICFKVLRGCKDKIPIYSWTHKKIILHIYHSLMNIFLKQLWHILFSFFNICKIPSCVNCSSHFNTLGYIKNNEYITTILFLKEQKNPLSHNSTKTLSMVISLNYAISFHIQKLKGISKLPTLLTFFRNLKTL